MGSSGIHNASTSNVDECGGWLHESQGLFVDQMVGFRCEWAAQNNIVGVLKQVRKCAPNRSPKGLCVGSWATIVIEDCHPKAMRPFGNFLTNAAQSNNAYRCPVNFTTQHVARI